jgi:hypothetical protein
MRRASHAAGTIHGRCASPAAGTVHLLPPPSSASLPDGSCSNALPLAPKQHAAARPHLHLRMAGVCAANAPPYDPATAPSSSSLPSLPCPCMQSHTPGLHLPLQPIEIKRCGAALRARFPASRPSLHGLS